MLMNEYAVEKLRELDQERLTRTAIKKSEITVLDAAPRTSKPVIGPVMRVAGKTLRRAGESLEGWATRHQPESETRWAERRTS
jgi:hypothetical protein